MTYERKTVDLLISDELRDILKEIEADSEVASLLLKKRHSKDVLVDSPVNYVSISSVDKARLSYLTVDRIESIDDNDLWTSSRRYHAKPGAFISKIFKDISSKEIEKFSNLFKSEVNKPKFTFKIIQGEDIKKYYHHLSYASHSGSLGVSCMKHDHCQNYLDVYINNSDKISMLVMLDEDDRLMGRSLLWKFDSHNIMDRIYTISDHDLQFYFKKWAGDNNYVYKTEQNWFNTIFFEKLGDKTKIELKLSMQLNMDNVNSLPYIDTFKFINTKTGYLYNFIPEDDFRVACGSDGSTFSSDYLRFDGIDKVFRYQGDSVYVEYLGFYTSGNNVQWSSVNGDIPILRSDCVYNDEIGDYIFNEERDELNNKNAIQELKEVREKRRSKPRRAFYDRVVDSQENTIDSSVSESYEIYNGISSRMFFPRGLRNRDVSVADYLSINDQHVSSESEQGIDVLPQADSVVNIA